MDKARLASAVDQLMASPNLRAARDVVRDEPGLLGNGVLSYLEESARRFRQLGNDKLVKSMEHWRGLIRAFRRYGIEEGYWELLGDPLVQSDADQIRQLLAKYPELSSAAARDYFQRRAGETHAAGDQASARKYGMAAVLASTKPAKHNLELDVSILPEFHRSYVLEDDDALRHRYLRKHPELLKVPASLIAEGAFHPPMEQAWAEDDLALLRKLFIRRAMFRRAGEVGVAKAIKEYEAGAEWPDLMTR